MRHRLQHLAAPDAFRLIAPLPWTLLRQAAPPGGGVPRGWHRDARLELWQPYWFYLPGGGISSPVCLCLRLLWAARQLRKRFPYALLDAQFGFPDGPAVALLAAMLGVPFAVTMRGSETLHSEMRFRRMALAWTLRRAGRVIAVSERLRQLAISLGASPERVKVIPNGVDSTVFRPLDRAACRLKLGIPLECRMLVAAGHLIPLKGFAGLIKAVHHVASRGLPAHLWIAGSAPDPACAESLRLLRSQLGLRDRVHFCGHVTQEGLADLMAAADLFCLTSSREGWPNVVHEAMSCGTPVVAADVGAIPQMIPSEDFGIIVPPQDESALAAALERAMMKTWDRERIAAWGKSRSWDQVAEELAMEWRELACQYSRS